MDHDFLHELFAPFGAIEIRRLFGGLSLSADGLTFALVAQDGLYLKADAETIPWFELEGSTPFRYESNGRTRVMASYWRMPERLYDDPDETADWARAALEAARRAMVMKGLKKKAVTERKPMVTKAAKRKNAPSS